MICRICFGEETPETMVSPCRCSGTSAYIHTECLNSYFGYFPDRICRVCRTEMEGPPNLLMSAMMMTLLGMSISYSVIPWTIKLAFTMSLLTITVYYAKKNLFNDTVATFLLAMYLTFATGGHPDALFIFLISLYAISLIFSIVVTRQLVLLLFIAPAVFALTAYIFLALDAFGTAVYLSLLFLAWYAWVRTAVRVQ
jgi:hypothetical protein